MKIHCFEFQGPVFKGHVVVVTYNKRTARKLVREKIGYDVELNNSDQTDLSKPKVIGFCDGNT